ncbi:TPA: hypothetical protein ACHK4V_005362, partial [Escherichia coli]
TSTGEQPDAMGFRNSASCLIGEMFSC